MMVIFCKASWKKLPITDELQPDYLKGLFPILLLAFFNFFF